MRQHSDFSDAFGPLSSKRRRGTNFAAVRRRLPWLFIALLLVYGLSFLWGDAEHASGGSDPAMEALGIKMVQQARGKVSEPGCDRGAAGAQAASGSALAGDFKSLRPKSDKVELRAAGAALDGASLSLAAWVLPPAPADGKVLSIQTIASTKASGCAVDADHRGVAVFLNEWQTNSGQLYLSWGSAASGCEEIATAVNSVKPGRWTHVAATLSASRARLYVDGELLADSERDGSGKLLGVDNFHHGGDQSAGVSDRLFRGGETALRVGAHADGTHPLHGLVAQLAVWPTELDASQVAALSCGAPPDGAVAGTPSRLPPPSLNLSFTHTGGRSLPEGSLSGAADPPLETVPIAQVVPKEDVAISARYVPPKADVAAAAAPAKAGWPLPWLPPRTLRRGTEAEVNASDALARVRLEAVRGAFKRAWGAYRKHAWGMDEIKPISNKSHDWLHLGATMIDCLDNLWIFGLKAEFDEAKEWVATKLSFSRAVGISMFETVIRIIGGLLSAFELSREAVFLRKAEELAGLMMYSFKANPETGVPCTTISLDGSRRCTFPTWTQRNAILAEFGTIQLEFKYLAHHTGRKEFWEVAERQIRNVRGRTQPAGLYPNFMSPKTLRWTTTKVSMGALADSFYEYLLKQWLLTQRTEPYLRTMFDEAMLGMARSMVARSTPSELVYIADYVSEGKLVHKMDHLACFAGGMLAVGAQHGGEFDREYMTLAERIGETCYEFYRRTTSGLSPEFMSFVGGSDPKVPRNAAYNIGRPEAVETFFIMWYYTRDPKWREMGWEVFSSFERHARTPSGWAALKDVNNPAKLDDKMESFVLAETMKYLFLLFDSSYPIPLDKYVFNTEAHPLGTFDASAFTSAAPPKRR